MVLAKGIDPMRTGQRPDDTVKALCLRLDEPLHQQLRRALGAP